MSEWVSVGEQLWEGFQKRTTSVFSASKLIWDVIIKLILLNLFNLYSIQFRFYLLPVLFHVFKLRILFKFMHAQSVFDFVLKTRIFPCNKMIKVT